MNKSISHHLRKPRPVVTTNAEQSKSSMWHLNRRRFAARHHHLLQRHRMHASKTPRRHPQMVINHLLVPGHHVQLVHQALLHQLDQDGNLSDQSPTTRLLAPHPLPLGLALQLAVRLVGVQDFLQEATRMVNHLLQLSLRLLQKVAFLNRKASNTRYQDHMPSQSILLLQSLASDSRAHSEGIRSSLAHQVVMPRVINAPTPSPRLSAA